MRYFTSPTHLFFFVKGERGPRDVLGRDPRAAIDGSILTWGNTTGIGRSWMILNCCDGGRGEGIGTGKGEEKEVVVL